MQSVAFSNVLRHYGKGYLTLCSAPKFEDHILSTGCNTLHAPYLADKSKGACKIVLVRQGGVEV
jgi:hypothetical protein